MNTVDVAESFSSHRFSEVTDRLAPTVRWVMPGQAAVEGKLAVAEACRATTDQLADLERIEFVRLISVGNAEVAAVDAISRYIGRDGSVAVVSSADFYEFTEHGLVATITSYAVEVPA